MLDLTNFKSIVNDLVYYLDDINGYKLFKMIGKEEVAAIEQDEENTGAYLALEFLIIPFFSTKEIAGLLKEKLSAGLMIEDINLIERITKKLIEIDLGDRDNFKKELKNALINSQEQITKGVTAEQNKKIVSVADWIKDYVSQVKGGSKINLSEAQYFYQKPYFVNLNEVEKNLLKKLFALYKFLDTSSLTPEGFEDDLLIEDGQGRLITTNKGKIVVLYDPKKIVKKLVVKAPENKIIKNVVEEQRPAPPVKSEAENNVVELKQLAAKYPPGSFERKAIEEEMEKMKHE
ncbi:MAG: hypothetical protein Q7K35_01505 [bacterium]|nr:hypothetical protein [bacterium]